MPNGANLLRPGWLTISQKQFRDNYRQLGSLRELAAFWGVGASQLAYYAFTIDKKRAYTTFGIPKRNGGVRDIEVPNRTLKYLQRLVHESLTRVYGPHRDVHGFRSCRSIVSNAKAHLGKRYVLNIDLADFFPSITRIRIYGRLTARPYALNNTVANVIATLSTNANGQLPQGSPSSPVISNILTASLDTELAKLCGSLGCRYTRYADDITISRSRGELPPDLARYPNARGTGQVAIGDRLVAAIENQGFRINERKTRLQSYWTRQMCTGLVVNGSQVSPPRSYVRRLRSLVDHWKKNGWQHAADVLRSSENRPLFKDRLGLLNHVMGRIGYLRMVRGQGDSVADRLHRIVVSIPLNF